MKKLSAVKIQKILERHKKWLKNSHTGGRAVLNNVHLANVYLRSENLRNAELSGSVFSGAIFEFVDLTGANLKNSDFSYVDFTSADLRYSNFTGATLLGAYFTGANLTGVECGYETPLARMLFFSGACARECQRAEKNKRVNSELIKHYNKCLGNSKLFAQHKGWFK